MKITICLVLALCSAVSAHWYGGGYYGGGNYGGGNYGSGVWEGGLGGMWAVDGAKLRFVGTRRWWWIIRRSRTP